MNEHRISRHLALAALLLAPAVALFAQEEPRLIQPGAPGQPSRTITAAEAADLSAISYTPADVEFMQGMISHHAQAIEMTALLGSRTRSPEMLDLGKRIELSQADEIGMMQGWLRDREEMVPDATGAMKGGDGEHSGHDMHAGHGGDGSHMMPGMLTPEQMAELAASDGVDFDRLFLSYMIEHHRGALVMVEDLLDKPGAAQESEMFAFTSDVVADQSAEIDRMGSMLAGLSNDPRVGLEPGFFDAGQSLMNLQLVAALPKPAGFFDADAPEGIPIPAERDDEGEEEAETSETSETSEASEDAQEDAEGEAAEGDSEAEESSREAREREEEVAARARRARSARILSFANSDMAFSENYLFEGSFHGFKTWNVEDPSNPRLLAGVICPGGQGDVSVVGDLLIMSVEQTRGRLDCGLQGISDPVSAERFRGVRIFDVSNPANPQQLAAVQTCRGSHTHTIVTDPDDDGTFYVYGSGTSSVRDGEELSGCSDLPPGEDENTALFSIDVIEVSMKDPTTARVVNRPRIFSDPDTGFIAGLWRGGTHGSGTQRTSETNQCHDITVFPDKGLAAGACSGNGILLDISDPVNPVRLDQVLDPGFAYWHSATFNNDGTKVVFTDEWGGGMRPRCRAADPRQWGANAIFDIADGKLEFRSYYKLPAPQTEQENCVAHNGSLIPVPGRDIMVQAWYQGGISVFDFTDSANPFEIAHFDRGPIDPEDLMMGGHWSAYWYDGHIYGTEIARGLDVLALQPSEFLTANEIAAASAIEQPVFNAQQQLEVSWPAQPVVARALVDQLQRSQSIDAETVRQLDRVLDRADDALEAGRAGRSIVSDLQEMVSSLEALAAAAEGREAARLTQLGSTLDGVAEGLR